MPYNPHPNPDHWCRERRTHHDKKHTPVGLENQPTFGPDWQRPRGVAVEPVWTDPSRPYRFKKWMTSSGWSAMVQPLRFATDRIAEPERRDRAIHALEVHMTLPKPTPGDVTKIHTEINQIVNQQLLLTTIAITLFGVIMAWVVPKDTPVSATPIGAFRFAAIALNQLLLLLLFLWAHQLGVMLRTLASYLIVTRSSEWEVAWQRCRKDAWVGYSKPRALVFLALGLSSALCPFVLWLTYPFELAPRPALLALVFTTVVYCVLIYGVAFLRWFNKDSKIMARWADLGR